MADHLDIKALSSPASCPETAGGHLPHRRQIVLFKRQAQSPLLSPDKRIMKTLLATLIVAGLWLGHQATSDSNLRDRNRDLGDFIREQNDISLQGVLANMGPDGSKAGGADPGVVVASPSKEDPDYFYFWTRDAALTLKVLVERFIAGDHLLRPKIQQYVASQAKLQGVSNPSGGPETGGLGEPKFHVNLTQFTGAWGRPQRDGPPLRATALTIYAKWLLMNGGVAEAADVVWPIISKDLAYAVSYWNHTGFDLWEEVHGSSFFTVVATHRALVEGAGLAKALNESCPDCESTAPQVLCLAQNFWADGHIISNINTDRGGRTGKDANSLLASIHAFDPNGLCTHDTFQPCSSRALANHKAVVDSFRDVYSINRGSLAGKAVAIGRYAEDVYQKGNPWYLTTLAAAEQLYDAVHQWENIGYIVVDSVSLGFFKDLLPAIRMAKYNRLSFTYESIITAVTAYADAFLAIMQQHTPSDGALAEQFDKDLGVPRSAEDLTWSHAAFLSTTDRKADLVGPSWGEPFGDTTPATCSPTKPRPPPPLVPCISTMTFNVAVQTLYGESVHLTGSLDELRNWSPANAIPMTTPNYTVFDPQWTVTVQLPADTSFQYKYIKKTLSGGLVWMSDPNLSAISTKECGSIGTYDDGWR